jgi:hypothetical protein
MPVLKGGKHRTTPRHGGRRDISLANHEPSLAQLLSRPVPDQSVDRF